MTELHATPIKQSALRAWARSHAYGLLSSLGRFVRQPFNHLLTLGVLALALALPTLGHLTLKNLKHLSSALSQPGDVSLFLKSDVNISQASALQDQVALMPGISGVSMKTPEQALAEFRELTRFTDALDVLDRNPLPFVLVVTIDAGTLKTERAMALVAQLRQIRQDWPAGVAVQPVEIVQFDQEWLLRLKALMALAEKSVWVFGALLAFTVLLVIGNTIRLEIAGRADEIQIVRLVGASNAFVRRPFLYSGFWFGAVGAGASIVLVTLAIDLLAPSVAALAFSYGSTFQLHGLVWFETLIVMAIGTGLGWLGALIASATHLRKSESAD
jgi:cell division transport system permease protein